MFDTIKPPNPLIIEYPRPPQSCPKSKVLYKVTFRYKSNLSGSKIYPVTDQNFAFEIYGARDRIKAGDIVKYMSTKKTDPNNNQIARVEKIFRFVKNRYALEQGMRSEALAGRNLYNIKFINPPMVSGRVVREKDEVTVKNLTKIPQLAGYICESPFVDSKKGQPGFANQQVLRRNLNSIITNMVSRGFIPNKSENKPKIVGRAGNWSLNFFMPNGSKPGDTITVGVGKTNVIVKIPLTSTQTTIPKPNDRITVPITKRLNSTNYDELRATKLKDGPALVFKPTLIDSLESNDYHGDDYKMVKPSENQLFKILNADIIKQNGDNFKFKDLDSFDKKRLAFDLQVDVYLKLSKKTITSAGEKEQAAKAWGSWFKQKARSGMENIFNKTAVLDCPKKKTGLKEALGVMKKNAINQFASSQLTSKKSLRSHAAGRAKARVSRRPCGRGGRRTKRRRKTRRRTKRRRKSRRNRRSRKSGRRK